MSERERERDLIIIIIIVIIIRYVSVVINHSISKL